MKVSGAHLVLTLLSSLLEFALYCLVTPGVKIFEAAQSNLTSWYFQGRIIWERNQENCQSLRIIQKNISNPINRNGESCECSFHRCFTYYFSVWFIYLAPSPPPSPTSKKILIFCYTLTPSLTCTLHYITLKLSYTYIKFSYFHIRALCVDL